MKTEQLSFGLERHTDVMKVEKSHNIPYPTGRRKTGQQTGSRWKDQFNFSTSERLQITQYLKEV